MKDYAAVTLIALVLAMTSGAWAVDSTQHDGYTAPATAFVIQAVTPVTTPVGAVVVTAVPQYAIIQTLTQLEGGVDRFLVPPNSPCKRERYCSYKPSNL